MTTPEQKSDKRISYLPTPGLSYDPSDARYWDPAALGGEVKRAFEICHGCRMCFKYCDSFPRCSTSSTGATTATCTGSPRATWTR